MAEYTVPLGTPSTITLPAPPSGYTWTGYGTTAPDGMAYKPATSNVLRIEGTPTTAGTTTRTLASDDGYGSGSESLEVTVTVVAPEQITAQTPTTTVPVGTPVVVNLAPILPSGAGAFTVTGTLPAGITAKSSASSATTLTGTATTEGDYPLTLQGTDPDYGENVGPALALTLRVAGPAVTIPVPAAQGTEDGYTLPEAEGVIWSVDGVDTEPGTYSVQPVTEPTTVTITPRAADGYTFEAEPEPLVLTFTPAPDPDPDPEPGPWEPPARPEGDYPGPWPAPAGPEPTPEDEQTWTALMDDDPQALFVAGKLSERIIRHAGMDVADLDPAEVLTARDHAMTVLEYVKGYTRDRGFVGYVPHRSLQAVIVAAGARLFVNPEQMTYYSTGDYSERPATMTGWTSAEVAVLRRFRKVYA